MCIAILRVKFKAPASTTTIEIASDEELETKIEELKNQAGVAAVKVYMFSEAHERVEVWQVG